jgi:hypothetical protein
MTTILPKEPVITDRASVILSNAERRNLRRKLRGSVEIAQDLLNPKTQLRRFVAKSKTEVKQVAEDVAQVAKENAPVIGAVGVGALIFLGRGPISKLYLKFRNRNNPPEGDEDRTET